MLGECIVCGGTRTKPLYAGLLQCQECDYVFANLMLSNDEWHGLYQWKYFFGEEYSNYLVDERVIKKNFELRFDVLRRFMDRALHRRLFEVGSAYGFFLDLVRAQFDTLQGIDIASDGVRYARERLNLDVIHADLLEHDLGDQRFDVVCMWDTIEHLRSPHLYVEKISKHMDSGALLALTTGDIGSVNARLRRGRWRLIHPPTHAHYFSRKTVALMLRKYGFQILYDRYCGFHRSMDSAAYNVLALRHGLVDLYRLLQKLGLLSFDFYLNLGDILYVIARKA